MIPPENSYDVEIRDYDQKRIRWCAAKVHNARGIEIDKNARVVYGKPLPGAKKDGAWVSAWVYVSVADLVWYGYNRKRKGPVKIPK